MTIEKMDNKTEHIELVKNFIVDHFLFGDSNGLKEDDSLLEQGIIDSTGILELVSFIEEHFNIKINDDELLPENLDSLQNIASFLQKKLMQNAN